MSEQKNMSLEKDSKDNILEVSHLKKYFPIKGGLVSRVVGHVKAVDDVTFNIKRGTTMGLVGESGCGKSTTGRTILRLINKTDGEVKFNGQDVYAMDKKQLRSLRTKMQIIFQDPYSSLNPRMKVRDIFEEELLFHEICTKEEVDGKIHEIIEKVGLPETALERYPSEFSGGQRQRIGIARAFLHDAPFLLMDEPTSNLDSLNEGIILKSLREEGKMRTVLLVSHRKSTMKVADVVFHMEPSVRKTRT